ncbi:MAG: hypothetical protein AB2L14_25255 [Candidatus Xenobiia bacterium LiM19]
MSLINSPWDDPEFVRQADDALEDATSLSHSKLDDLENDDHTSYLDSTRADTWLDTKDTDDLDEGTDNLYANATNLNAWLATRTTNNLTEGTNQYHTNARVESYLEGTDQKGVNCTPSGSMLEAKALSTRSAVVYTLKTGLDDLTADGTYSGTSDESMEVEIDLADTTDTFKWRVDDGTWTEDVSVIADGTAQDLADGVTVEFGALTGHTLGDKWTIPVVSDAIGAATYTPLPGLDDATASGTYIGATNSTFEIVIDGVGATNTFKWRKDSGSWTTTVNASSSPVTLQEGVRVTFAATTGHKLGDKWVITCTAKHPFNAQNAAGSDIFTLGNDGRVQQHVNLLSGKVFKINDTQVVGAQQTYLAALGTDYTCESTDDLNTALSDIAIAYNDLLAAVKAHGLVATSA